MSHKFFDMFEICLIFFFMKKINAPSSIIKNLYFFYTPDIETLLLFMYNSIFTYDLMLQNYGLTTSDIPCEWLK